MDWGIEWDGWVDLSRVVDLTGGGGSDAQFELDRGVESARRVSLDGGFELYMEINIGGASNRYGTECCTRWS